MDDRLRQIERQFQELPSDANFENLVRLRTQATKHLQELEPITEVDSTILFVMTPLEFSAQSYHLSRESYFNLIHYYQDLIRLMATAPGRVFILHNPTWMTEATTSSIRHPGLQNVNQQFLNYLLFLSRNYPHKFINANFRLAAVSHLTARTFQDEDDPSDALTVNLEDGSRFWLPDLALDGVSQVFYTGGRPFHLFAFIAGLSNQIRRYAPEIAFGQYIFWHLMYGNSDETNDYLPMSDARTWWPRNLRGFAMGSDQPILDSPIENAMYGYMPQGVELI